MADPTSSIAENPSALMQLLALLQQQQGASGTPPSAATFQPNQTLDRQGNVFQLGSGGVPTAENPGSSPDASLWGSTTNANGTFGVAPQDSPSFGGNTSGGNSGYGYQGPGNQMSQQGSSDYDTWMNGLNTAANSKQFNQLIQGLLKQYQSKPPTAPAPATPVPPPAPVPVVPNNQVAYTDPTKAVIPGMGATTLPQAPAASLPAQLQQGMTQKDIMAQGGPLQASTDTSTNLPKYDTVNQQVVNGQVETQPSVGSQPDQGGGAGSATIAPVQVTSPVVHADQVQTTPPSSIPPEHAHLGSDFQSYAPASTRVTLPSNTPGVSGMMGDIPGVSGAQVPAGNVSPTTGATGQVTMPSDITGASGYVANVPGVTGSQAAASANTPTGGSGMTPEMGSVLAKGVGQIGAAISSAYKPIKLPTVQTVQQPKPLVFGVPPVTQ